MEREGATKIVNNQGEHRSNHARQEFTHKDGWKVDASRLYLFLLFF
jgi:hypothetical protein